MSRIYHVQAEVLESEPRGKAHHRLLLLAPKIAAQARPGQFVHCAPSPPAKDLPLLRRPFSISRVMRRQVSSSPDCIELFFRIIGPGTRRLAQRSPGEVVDCLGPLGNGFTVVAEKVSLLIAGGTGIAPLRWLAAELAESGGEVHLLVGAESPDCFPCPLLRQKDTFRIPELEALGVHAEFVSEEDRLLVTDLLARQLPELLRGGRAIQAYAAGPREMLRAVADLLPADLPCQASLEEHMPCGVGACRSCVVAIRNPSPPGYTYKRVCREGPVFDLRQVIWQTEGEIA